LTRSQILLRIPLPSSNFETHVYVPGEARYVDHSVFVAGVIRDVRGVPGTIHPYAGPNNCGHILITRLILLALINTRVRIVGVT